MGCVQNFDRETSWKKFHRNLGKGLKNNNKIMTLGLREWMMDLYCLYCYLLFYILFILFKISYQIQ
jgi:hypothetical protein